MISSPRPAGSAPAARRPTSVTPSWTAPAFSYQDEMAALGALADTETHMIDILDQLDLTGVVTPMPSLSAAGRR